MPRHRHLRLATDPRAGVLVLVAVLAPLMLMAGAFAIDAAYRRVTALDLQHRADAAAMAGAAEFAINRDAQSATAMAAALAAVNGVPGGGALRWDQATRTTSNKTVAATLTYGASNAAALEAVSVTVRRTPPAGLSGGFSGSRAAAPVTVSALAELTPAPPAPAAATQPCLVTLGSDMTDGKSLAFSFSGKLLAPGCAVWSNGSLSMINTSTLEAADIHVAGTITRANNPKVTGAEHPGAAKYPDPYATRADIAAKLAGLKPGTGPAVAYGDGTYTLAPGAYASWTFTEKALVTLRPGTYWVNGDILVKNNAELSGTGVTIVASGSVIFQNSSKSKLSASGGSAAGVLLLITSGSLVKVMNDSAHEMTGVIYAPSAVLETQNSPQVSGVTCLEAMVKRAVITNSAIFRMASCAGFAASPSTRKPVLTQ